LTEEELARFLAAHAGQPAAWWAAAGATQRPPRRAALGFLGPVPARLAVAGPPRGSYREPGASARAVYRRLRAGELADWRRRLAWRLPLVGGVGVTPARC